MYLLYKLIGWNHIMTIGNKSIDVIDWVIEEVCWTTWIP
jgi:hypothetical protein